MNVQEDYPDAERITLVMGNLNTHIGASLYKAFPPDMARALLDKLAFVYTPPKHGSWLNMAECGFRVLGRQCLARRLPDRQTVTTEIAAWMEDRNQKTWPADWRFTTEDARIKLKRPYPKLSDRWTTRHARHVATPLKIPVWLAAIVSVPKATYTSTN